MGKVGRTTRTELRHQAHITNGGYVNTALEDVNFGYTDDEADVLVAMWNEGRCLLSMGKTLNRPPLEIFVVLAQLDIEGRLDERPGKVWGDKRDD